MYFHGIGGWWRYISHDESKGRPSVDRALLRRVLIYAQPYWFLVSIVILTIIGTALIDLIPPLLFRNLIDVVIPNADFAQLNWLALGMIGIPIISGLIGVLNRYASSRAGEGIIYDLRQEMYTHIQRMSIRFFTHTKSGEIISRLNNDVIGAQNAITGTLPGVITNAFTLISTLVIMVYIEWRLAVLSIIVLPLFLLPARRVALILREIRRQAMEYNADMSSIIGETLSINGAMLVKIFGRQRQEVTRYRETNTKVREIGVRRALVGRWFFMGLGLSAAIGTALLYWAGGHLVLDGAITVGTIVAFSAYIFRLYGPISALTNIQVEISQSMVSFERVFEYLDLPVEIEDKTGALALDGVKGSILFEGVSFSYLSEEDWKVQQEQAATNGKASPTANRRKAGRGQDFRAHGGGRGHGEGIARIRGGLAHPFANQSGGHQDGEMIATVASRRWALRELTFEINPGELVALVGPSGAGKTTITYLLPRLYDPTEGRIALDGHDLRDVTQESIAAQIGIVTQETYLFHDTLRANLLYAKPDATEAELETACRAANIHEFIAKLPNGYDTIVGERGYRFSGGEKQRIAIARVILKDPRVLILDEATSHLDSHSEALIQIALEPLFNGRTSIVIAHRLSTILAANKILIFDKGHLIEQGAHEELLAQGGLYAHLYQTQFRQEEALKSEFG